MTLNDLCGQTAIKKALTLDDEAAKGQRSGEGKTLPRIHRALFGLCCLWLAAGLPAQAQPPVVQRGPGYARQDFIVTTFAKNLHFPLSMQQLSDGSLLVGTSNPTGGSFFSSVGELVRLNDTNNDGVADGTVTILFTGLPGGVTSVRQAGDLILATSSEAGNERISILRTGARPSDPLVLQGSLRFGFPSGWEHTTFALAVAPVSGQNKQYHVVFNVGSKENSTADTETVALQGLLTGVLNGGSLYRFTLQDFGDHVTASNLIWLAKGLRNAAGIAFHPQTADLYFEENGIDTPSNRNEPLSADELNLLKKSDIGQTVVNYGFPNDYIEYRTDKRVGSGGVLPLATFEPLPDPFTGSESEGAVEIAFAPPLFPRPLRQSVFIGFHGKFGQAGLENEENPLLCYDIVSGRRFQFIGNNEPNIGHPDGLLSTSDALFVSDWSSGGSFGQNDTGAIYRIKYAPVTRLFVPDTNGSSGKTVSLEGRLALKADITGIANQTLTFQVSGVVVGSATTNPQGTARLSYFVPSNRKPGDYALSVLFAGQSVYRASRQDALLHIK